MQTHRIIGSELSPYSVKVRSYFRYKGIPHRWLPRNAETQAEFQKYARLPLIPLVITPDARGLQDSTPILEAVELAHPEPSIHPNAQPAVFVSALLEELGDEWGNKWMFHYRWARDVDQWSAAGRIARSMQPDAGLQQVAEATAKVRERMLGRVGLVGSSAQTATQIERSFQETLECLELHLRERSYLFGARPVLADFGLFAQLYQAWTDPTAGAWIEGRAPSVLAWIQRMLWPRVEGELEAWERVESGLLPLLDEQAAQLFLPWSCANEAALSAGDATFSVPLRGETWTQAPQKYHARSLAALRAKYADQSSDPAVRSLMERTGCATYLQR